MAQPCSSTDPSSSSTPRTAVSSGVSRGRFFSARGLLRGRVRPSRQNFCCVSYSCHSPLSSSSRIRTLTTEMERWAASERGSHSPAQISWKKSCTVLACALPHSAVSIPRYSSHAVSASTDGGMPPSNTKSSTERCTPAAFCSSRACCWCIFALSSLSLASVDSTLGDVTWSREFQNDWHATSTLVSDCLPRSHSTSAIRFLTSSGVTSSSWSCRSDFSPVVALAAAVGAAAEALLSSS
mmetsp:Transcript_58695/g.138330  ORF Transcript_58695/g.138330 Transcript_58695/m.138330 type:complete len:239 (-) Transcript_58695:685-1401(-)